MNHGQRVCPTCGSTFKARRVNHIYCSVACRPSGSRTNTTERGYGYAHQQQRLHWERRLRDGEHVECHAKVCFYPSRWINPAEPWDLGHTLDRTGWTGPEHVKCNRTEPQLRDEETRRNRVRGPRRWVL